MKKTKQICDEEREIWTKETDETINMDLLGKKIMGIHGIQKKGAGTIHILLEGGQAIKINWYSTFPAYADLEVIKTP